MSSNTDTGFFRPGDTVRRTSPRGRDSARNYRPAGYTFTVESVEPRPTSTYGDRVFEAGDSVNFHTASRLELVSRASNSFVVGDVVRRRVGAGFNAGVREGEEFTVTRVRRGDGFVAGTRVTEGHHDSANLHHDPANLELVRHTGNVDPATLQPGDVVRLTGTRWSGSERGEEFTILPREEWGDHPAVRRSIDGAKLYLCGTWTAELVRRAETVPTRVADLVVGDVVRLSGGGWVDHPAQGREVTVTRVGDFTRVTGGYHINDSLWPFVFVRHAGDATPAPAAEATFSRYTPAMLPMFTALADAADRAGHCHEYDRLAATVGAPSREEIRRLNTPALVLPHEDGLYVDASADILSPSSRTVIYKRQRGVWYRVPTNNSGSIREETPTVPVAALVKAS